MSVVNKLYSENGPKDGVGVDDVIKARVRSIFSGENGRWRFEGEGGPPPLMWVRYVGLRGW